MSTQSLNTVEERRAARLLAKEEKRARSVRFAKWKEECAAHKVQALEAEALYKSAYAHAEELRLYWKGLQAPKLKQ
jgi:hypothetical protein